MLHINHLNIGVPQTINNYNHIPIDLCVVSHESFEIGFWKPVLQHCFIKLNFSVLKLHITNCYDHHFTLSRIVHMTNHSCPTNNTFHMIKHDPNILQIPYSLHSCDEVNSTPNTIYWHLENKHFFSYNLSWETSLLNVVITSFGLQFKDVINISTSWMTLERNNKVTNIGRTEFTELVQDVLQVLTLEEFHYIIAIIIKQITCQEGLVSTQGNCIDLYIKCVIHLLYDQPSNVLNKLPTLSIHNKMVVNTKMNHCSWHRLESMHK